MAQSLKEIIRLRNLRFRIEAYQTDRGDRRWRLWMGDRLIADGYTSWHGAEQERKRQWRLARANA